MGVLPGSDIAVVEKRLLTVCRDLQKRGVQLNDGALASLRASTKPKALDALLLVQEECIDDSEDASIRVIEILGAVEDAGEEVTADDIDLDEEDLAALDAAEVEVCAQDDVVEWEDPMKVAKAVGSKPRVVLHGVKRVHWNPSEGAPSSAPRMRILQGGVGASSADEHGSKGKGKKGKKAGKGKGSPDPDKGLFASTDAANSELEKIIVNLSERSIELSAKVLQKLRKMTKETAVAVLQDFSDRADTIPDYEAYLQDSIGKCAKKTDEPTAPSGPALFKLRFLQAMQAEEDRKARKGKNKGKGKDKGKDKGKEGEGKGAADAAPVPA